MLRFTPDSAPLVPAVLDPGHQLLLRRRIARQLVRDQHARRPALALEELAQEALGGPLVAPALDQHVEYDAVLVARPPQPVLLARDLDLDLVQVPLVAGTGQPPADLVREALAELERPLPHGLVADRDAAGGQQLLDHPQGEREAEVEPDRVADDLGREAVAGVGRSGGWRHPGPIAGSPPARNPSPANLTVSLMERGKPAGTPGRIALPVAGDDAAAKAVVLRLIDELGFDGVDAGGLDESWRQQPDTPVYGTNHVAEGVRRALAEASPERKPEWRATPNSPGDFASPA